LLLFGLYTFVIIALIVYNGCFGIFKDERISNRQYALLFLGKLLAVPVFLMVYKRFYGGIEQFDAGKFYHDVLAISGMAKENFSFFLKLMLGMQDDTVGSPDYEYVVSRTVNWTNGHVKDYLYNDNRVLVRTHVILNLLAFGSYLVHALLSCFMSFVGIQLIYKSFKPWFENKSLLVMVVLCFFPALWFYTGGLLKEGLTLLVTGALVHSLKKIITVRAKISGMLLLIFLLWIALLLKPYLLLFFATSVALFFMISKWQVKNKALVFLTSVVAVVLLLNLGSILVKNRSMPEAAMLHQQRFVGVSKGGIFLEDSARFVRLKNDSSLVKRVAFKKDSFTISKGAAFMYWRPHHPNDTLYCEYNTDTLTRLELVYIIPESHSNLNVHRPTLLQTLVACAYYSLFHPFFFNASNPLQMLASFENVLVVVSLLLVGYGLIRSKKEKLLPLVFVLFALSLCILVAFTAPNSGAVIRYRAPGLVFLLLSGLYFLESVNGPSRDLNQKANNE